MFNVAETVTSRSERRRSGTIGSRVPRLWPIAGRESWPAGPHDGPGRRSAARHPPAPRTGPATTDGDRRDRVSRAEPVAPASRPRRSEDEDRRAGQRRSIHPVAVHRQLVADHRRLRRAARRRPGARRADLRARSPAAVRLRHLRRPAAVRAGLDDGHAPARAAAWSPGSASWSPRSPTSPRCQTDVAGLAPLGYLAAGGFVRRRARPAGPARSDRVRVTDSLGATLLIVVGVVAFATLIVLSRIPAGTQAITVCLSPSGGRADRRPAHRRGLPWPRLAPQVPRGAAGVVARRDGRHAASAVLGSYLVAPFTPTRAARDRAGRGGHRRAGPTSPSDYARGGPADGRRTAHHVGGPAHAGPARRLSPWPRRPRTPCACSSSERDG